MQKLDCLFQSTHPRRVRLYALKLLMISFVFQSTHPRRVRPLEPIACRISPFGFNPRTHVGCDDIVFSVSASGWCFNPRTHVGCDPETLVIYSILKMFQSTHPRRVRRYGAIELYAAKMFQSTHPRRVRQGECPVRIALFCFNPRTHVGCDFHSCNRFPRHRVSIHAPT